MENSKTVTQTLLGETAHFGFCTPKIGFFLVFFFSLDSSYFCFLGVHAKLQNCSANPSEKNSPFWLLPAQNRLFGGARGGPQIFFFIGIFIFLWVRTPCKKLNFYDTPFWAQWPILAFFRQKTAFFIGIIIFLWVRTPCKKLNFYNTPFWANRPILAFVRLKSFFFRGLGGLLEFFFLIGIFGFL